MYRPSGIDRRNGGAGGIGAVSRRLEPGHEAGRVLAAAERADAERGTRPRHDLPAAFGGLARVARPCRGGAGKDACRAARAGSAGRRRQPEAAMAARPAQQCQFSRSPATWSRHGCRPRSTPRHRLPSRPRRQRPRRQPRRPHLPPKGAWHSRGRTPRRRLRLRRHADRPRRRSRSHSDSARARPGSRDSRPAPSDRQVRARDLQGSSSATASDEKPMPSGRHVNAEDVGMARATGLEPATSGVTGRRSNQLSYARNPRARPAVADVGALSRGASFT